MRIGIFTSYGPNTVLGKEGLGRYLGGLISGFVDSGNDVTVACPKWSLNTIKDLFDDFGINPDKISLIVSDKAPIALKLFYLKKQKKKRKKKYRTINTQSLPLRILFRLMMTSSFFVFILLSILAVTAFIVALPILVLALLFVFLLKILKKANGKIVWSAVKTSKKAVKLILNKLSMGRGFLIEKTISFVSKDLIKKINTTSSEDIWFIPSLFWPEAVKINGVKVFCAPDLVTVEYPLLFGNNSQFISATKTCSSSLRHGEYFITYCDYLRKSLVMERFGHDESHVITIPHPNNEMSRYISIDRNHEVSLGSKESFTTSFARSILQSIINKQKNQPGEYLKSFDASGMKYIFYASQIRPHKNILMLVKALNIVLRRKNKNIKLIITGDINSKANPQKEIKKYIIDSGLQYDVLSIPNVSAQELAALYRCAEISVNPTLYEGGFPFTFGEGMSVGTPSLMSDIPQTREVAEEFDLVSDMLFDPYDPESLAERISFALDHRDELYKKELPLYKRFEMRTERVVADEYVAAFVRFMDLANKSVV